MIKKIALPGTTIYKSFGDFVKELSHSLEKEHFITHNAHKKARVDLDKKHQEKGSK